MSIVKSGYRTRRASRLTAELRVLTLTDEVRDLSSDLSRLRAAVMDVLHALPEDRGSALRRLRLEMAGRGHRRAA